MSSGVYRRNVALRRSHLERQLASLSIYDSLYNVNDSQPQIEQSLNTNKYALQHDIDRINSSIEQIKLIDSNWTGYVNTVAPEGIEDELAFYEEHAVKGYLPVVLSAEEKIHTLRAKLREVEDCLKEMRSPSQSVVASPPPETEPRGSVTTAHEPAGTDQVTQPVTVQTDLGLPLTAAPEPIATTTTSVVTVTASQPRMSIGTPQASGIGLSQPYNVSVPGVNAGPPVLAAPAEAVDNNMHSLVSAFRNLPALPLTTFSGDPMKWLEFWDMFNETVHCKPMPKVQKFQYLKRMLTGNALAVLSGMLATNDSYDEAIALLQEQFGNKAIIKHHLYAELDNIPRATNKPGSLRSTVLEMDKVLRQLRLLNENVTGNQTMIIRKILDKIPRDILLAIQPLKQLEQEWTVETLRAALMTTIRIREDVELTRPKPNESSKSAKQDSGKQDNSATRTDVFAVGKSKGPSANSCVFCGRKGHCGIECRTVPTFTARSDKCRELNLCFRCFSDQHFTKGCRAPVKKCKFCQKTTHAAELCIKQFGGQEQKSQRPYPQRKSSSGPNQKFKGSSNPQSTNKGESSSQPKPTEANSQGSANQTTETSTASNEVQSIMPVRMTRATHTYSVLMTAQIPVSKIENAGNAIRANVFFDPGSSVSFVTNKLKSKLKLESEGQETLACNSFMGRKSTLHADQVSLQLLAKDGSTKRLRCYAAPRITDKMTKPVLSLEDQAFIRTLNEDSLAEPIENSQFSPDVLIGADNFWSLVLWQQPVELPSGLLLINTVFGLILTSSTSPLGKDHDKAVTCALNVISAVDSEAQGDHDLMTSYSLELIGITDDPYTKDDDALAQRQFDETVQFINGRYEVCWPLRDQPRQLASNYNLAHRRLESVLRHLAQDPLTKEKYAGILEEQLKLGIIEVAPSDPEGPVFYLPHHCVQTPSKDTTKYRLVYDGSSCQRGELSLNQTLLRGSVHLPDVPAILLNFRLGRFGIAADLERAFLQVSLRPDQRDLTRFIWVKDLTKPPTQENLVVYRFARVPFGTVSSPFLLQATIERLFKDSTNPVVQKLAGRMYVDNVITTLDTIEEVQAFYTASKELFNSASMNLREYTTNCADAKSFIPSKDQAQNLRPKILGIIWDVETDTLRLSAPKIDKHKGWPTKRTVMSTVASAYDPLQWLAPAVFSGRLFVQELWRQKLAFDDPIPESLIDTWREIESNLAQVVQIELPRWWQIDTTNSFQLHCFVDASIKGYAAVIYLRELTKTTHKVFMVMSRTRLAPLERSGKVITIPRLELLAVLIGCRLLKYVRTQLKLSISEEHLWSDSQVVLSWIENQTTTHNVFVENRVTEIRNSPAVLHYIRSAENPADCASRGIPTSDLLNPNHIWWNGPLFLQNDASEWPEDFMPQITPEIQHEVDVEVRGNQKIEINSVDIGSEENTIGSRVSQLSKKQRIAGYVLRFIKAVAHKRSFTGP